MHGPSGHQVNARATFFGKHRTEPIGSPHQLPNLVLPIKAYSGRAYLAQLARTVELQNGFDFADSCRIDFSAEELGRFSLTFEREFTPLRWVVERKNNSYLLSLSDDSGAYKQASVTRYEFARPDRSIDIAYEDSFEDYLVPPSGGLYVARGSEAECSIIFPPDLAGTVRTFADMNRTVIEPQFQSRQTSVDGLRDEIALFTLWTESRTTGAMMALLAQQRVLQAHMAHIFGAIGGPKWAASESAYYSNPNGPNAAAKLCEAVTDVRSICRSVSQQYQNMRDVTPKEHAIALAAVFKSSIKPVRLVRTLRAAQQGVVVSRGERWQAEFALRLASAPDTLVYWARDWFMTGLKCIIDNRPLARAARFLVLTSSNYVQSTEGNTHTSLYAGWDWR
jgi:hypothetical protein